MKNPIVSGSLIALAAATLLAAGCGKRSDGSGSSSSGAPAAQPADRTAKVHCQGVNECKGKASCKAAANACAGQNGCKGQGFVEGLTADECTRKGGTVLASN